MNKWGKDMLSLKDKAEIYRIGLTTGLFVTNDIIEWVDKVIDIQEDFPYEFIEISLLASARKADIASKLSKIEGISDRQLIIYVFLGLCSDAYNSNKFAIDYICTFLYYLVSAKIDIPIDQDIEQKIHYFSDGYYLASEGIYGDLSDIRKELKEFLDQYNEYVEGFYSKNVRFIK